MIIYIGFEFNLRYLYCFYYLIFTLRVRGGLGSSSGPARPGPEKRKKAALSSRLLFSRVFEKGGSTDFGGGGSRSSSIKFREFEGGSWRSFPVVDEVKSEFEGGSWRSVPADFKRGGGGSRWSSVNSRGVVEGVFRPISTGASGVPSNQSNPPGYGHAF